MKRNEFLKRYANLPLKLRSRPIFLYGRKGISWQDIYSDLYTRNDDRFLKLAEKKNLLKKLIKDSGTF